MKTISVAEARKHFAEITDELRSGTPGYIVMRHGKEVCRMMPPTDAQDVDPNLEADIAEFFDEYGDVLTELAKK